MSPMDDTEEPTTPPSSKITPEVQAWIDTQLATVGPPSPEVARVAAQVANERNRKLSPEQIAEARKVYAAANARLAVEAGRRAHG